MHKKKDFPLKMSQIGIIELRAEQAKGYREGSLPGVWNFGMGWKVSNYW